MRSGGSLWQTLPETAIHDFLIRSRSSLRAIERSYEPRRSVSRKRRAGWPRVPPRVRIVTGAGGRCFQAPGVLKPISRGLFSFTLFPTRFCGGGLRRLTDTVIAFHYG